MWRFPRIKRLSAIQKIVNLSVKVTRIQDYPDIFEWYRHWSLGNGFRYDEGEFHLRKNKPTESSHFVLNRVKGSSGVVVFLHGTGDHALFPGFFVMQHLLQKGWDVFSFDLPGHGPYSSTIFDRATIDDCLRSAIAIIRNLMGDVPVHVIGHSLGGVLALHGLALHHISIDSLVLIGVPIHLDISFTTAFMELRYAYDREFWQRMKEFGFWSMLPAFGAFKRADFPIRLSSRGAKSQLGYIGEVVSLLADLQLGVGDPLAFDFPCLGIYGQHDRISTPAQGRRLLARCPGSELVEVAGKNHFTVNFAEQTLAAIEAFLAKA